MYANTDEMLNEAWAGSPMNGVDLEASAGVAVGNNSFTSRMTVEFWSLVIVIGALAFLWLFGGIVFRRINIA